MTPLEPLRVDLDTEDGPEDDQDISVPPPTEVPDES